MNDLQRTVWTKLQHYRIDEPASGPQGMEEPAFGFDRRLARENGWSVGYARRVLEEYKRFLYLALFAGHPVCPSEEVDQCWHMHMTYTRSYWDRLCKDILGMPLHHDPSRGGKSEDLKHDDMYAKTKAAYTRSFGSPPPEDIWPSASERFDHTRRFRRVDLSAMYMISRQRAHRAAMIGGGVLLSSAVAGCTRAAGSNATTAVLIFICFIAVLMIIALIARAVRSSRHRGCTSSSGCGGGWFFGGDGGSFSDSGSRPGGLGHGHGDQDGHGGQGGHGDHGGHGGHGGHGSHNGHGGHGTDGGHGGDGGSFDGGSSDGGSGDGGSSGCSGGGDGGGSGCGGGGCGGGCGGS